MMFNNPLIKRYRYSLLRPMQLCIYVAIYCTVAGLILYLNYVVYRRGYSYSSTQEFAEAVYYQFITFQVLLLIVFGSYNSGSAISEEVVEKSYDFFKLLPLAAYKKAIGILAGKNLVVIVFAMINLVILFIVGQLTEFSLSLQIQIIAVLIVATILTNTTALLMSVKPDKKGSKASKGIGIIVLVFFVMPAIMNAMMFLSQSHKMEAISGTFYELELPMLILIGLVGLYFSGWSFKGVVRKLNYDREPLFTRAGAFLFMFATEIVLFGLFYKNFESNTAMWPIFLTSSAILCTLTMFGMLRNFDGYLEHSRVGKSAISYLAVHSNITIAAGLAVIWTGFAIAAMLFTGHGAITIGNFSSLVVLLSFYAVIVALVELYTVNNPAYKKIGILVGFLGALYFILPLIFAGVFDNEIFINYSAFGYLINLIENEDQRSLAIDISICVINALLAMLPVFFIILRYERLAKIRWHKVESQGEKV